MKKTRTLFKIYDSRISKMSFRRMILQLFILLCIPYIINKTFLSFPIQFTISSFYHRFFEKVFHQFRKREITLSQRSEKV